MSLAAKLLAVAIVALGHTACVGRSVESDLEIPDPDRGWADHRVVLVTPALVSPNVIADPQGRDEMGRLVASFLEFELSPRHRYQPLDRGRLRAYLDDHGLDYGAFAERPGEHLRALGCGGILRLELHRAERWAGLWGLDSGAVAHLTLCLRDDDDRETIWQARSVVRGFRFEIEQAIHAAMRAALDAVEARASRGGQP